MVKVEDKLAKAVDCLEYFTTRQWNFKNDNVRKLSQALDAKDRVNFQIDVSTMIWEEYVEKYVLGFREFLFKQNPNTLPDSRIKLRRYLYNK